MKLIVTARVYHRIGPGFCYNAEHLTDLWKPTMSDFTIYHNPRCSKSRATLALLEENGITPDIVLYQETPLQAGELTALLSKLDMSAAQLVRSGETDYKEAGLDKSSSQQAIVAAMVSRPKLIERPIVVKGNRAVLGRPPENVLALISQ